MDAPSDANDLVAGAILTSSRPHNAPELSITPQLTICQIEELLECHEQHTLYLSFITSQNESINPTSLAPSSTTSSSSRGSRSSSASSPTRPTSSLATTPPAEFRSDEFILFPLLPMEIRTNIWQVAAESIDGRIISIEPDDEFEDAGRGCQCRAQAALPALFSTCSESRAEALRCYALKFHDQLRRPIYFNGEKDILFMSRTSSMFSFLQSTYEFERLTHEEYDRNEVQNLALLVNDTEVNFWGEDSLHGYPSWRQVSMAAISFANLKELRLIYRRENGEYTTEFQREKLQLAMYWTRHWSSWQESRARALRMARNLVIHPRASRAPEIVFWSRDELEAVLPTQERWAPENFQRRSRGSPEPLYGRNQMSFFRGIS